MFTFFQVGALEVLLAFVIFTGATLFVVMKQRSAWKWLAVITCILMFATLCTPADPFSMLLVAIATSAVFAAGVFLSPYLADQPTMNSFR